MIWNECFILVFWYNNVFYLWMGNKGIDRLIRWDVILGVIAISIIIMVLFVELWFTLKQEKKMKKFYEDNDLEWKK